MPINVTIYPSKAVDPDKKLPLLSAAVLGYPNAGVL
jgi:hypothetical protein